MKERFKLIASIYLLLKKDEKILLMRRFNTGYEDGNYGLAAGHLDGDETLRAGMVREAKEEIGIDIHEDDLQLVTVMHRRQEDERVDFFFEVEKWEGEPQNMEPDKCDQVAWFSLNDLPENTIPYIRQAIEAARDSVRYSEFWQPE